MASKPTPVRIEADLYAAIIKIAKKHRRSTTAEINDALLTWVQVSEEWALPEEGEESGN